MDAVAAFPAPKTLAVTSSNPRGWLYSPAIDLCILLVPLLAGLSAFALESAHGGDKFAGRAYALFLGQFVFGNTTHVVLTFLVLALRRDLLSPVPGQKRTIVLGSALTFCAAFALLWTSGVAFPFWADFGLTIGYVFSEHHRQSQVKGLWALYSLRSKQPFNKLERKVQQSFVPIGLLLLIARLTLFPNSPNAGFAVLVPIPHELAPLPYAGIYLMLGAYLVYAAVGIYSLFQARASTAKKIYLTAQFGATAFAIYSPIWGNIIMGSIHGLEYYFLSARLLTPLENEKLRFSRPAVWGVMFFAMMPVVIVGVLNAPFAAGFIAHSQAMTMATISVSAVVMAHYFADAFLYRLRLPEVRKVVLGRLRFTPQAGPSTAR